MKIYSIDKKSWIIFESVNDDQNDYSSFSSEAFVDLGHSIFQGKNSDLHFFNVGDFGAQLDGFIMDRGIQPRLSGTYDTYLMFKGVANKIILSFRIGSAFRGAEAFSYVLEGAFEISQEDLNSIVSGFSKYK